MPSRTIHNAITVTEAAQAALRLIANGMSLKHAVSISSSSFGFEPDDLYIEISKIEGEAS